MQPVGNKVVVVMVEGHGFLGNYTNEDSWGKTGFLALAPFFGTSPCASLRIFGDEQ